MKSIVRSVSRLSLSRRASIGVAAVLVVALLMAAVASVVAGSWADNKLRHDIQGAMKRPGERGAKLRPSAHSPQRAELPREHRNPNGARDYLDGRLLEFAGGGDETSVPTVAP